MSFQVGERYKTKGGRTVAIVREKFAETPYHCVEGNDGIWRYNRQGDLGRVTASAFDMSDPGNLLPGALMPKDRGDKQYLMKRLEGYRAACKGIARMANWYSPVRPHSSDEHGWFDGWDLAQRDGVAKADLAITDSKGLSHG